MIQAQAIEIVTEMLIWLSAREDDMGAFLAASGLSPAELRRRAKDPELLGFVMDFLLAEEARLLSACDAVGLPPEKAQAVRAALPGGDAPFWT